MAERTRTHKSKETEKGWVNMAEGSCRTFKVKRAHEFDNGNVSFDFECEGFSFYRATVVKGKNGDFVSFPSYESNGKYYKYYFIELSDDEQNALIDAVYACLDE